MKISILLIPISLCMTGCLNPKLCETKESIGKKGLATEHIEYFKDKPTLSVAEAHGTILPIAHVREHLQKRSDGYRYVNYVSLFGGLLLEGGSTQNFDQKGKPVTDKAMSGHINMLSGLLFEIDIDADMNNLSGSINKSFLMKSFGSTQEIGGSKYYTIFWMPMKFSNQAIEAKK
ncbi:hypothetical protein [Pontiella sulfatireligans]|uniref:Uncharacterized protein n=1 Tax=Pontiella sulfatireligans TaxID=2750658 RepID=A0A6C2UW72_9BACT|nr:hypothetical protein [Pontiella sulfatireligans]VGO23357.1 hypothetical protein SCARR_05464 [Pontiella sulfatireligans]